MYRLTSIAVLMHALSACRPAQPPVEQGSRPPVTAGMPTVTLPPELDRVLRDYEQQWRAKNATGLAALFTPDGFVLPSNEPPARGTAGIEKAYAGNGGRSRWRPSRTPLTTPSGISSGRSVGRMSRSTAASTYSRFGALRVDHGSSQPTWTTETAGNYLAATRRIWHDDAVFVTRYQ